jgi:hypothetical protein
MPVGLNTNKRILFALVEIGFTLLADDTFGSDLWKDTAYAKTNLEAITD